MTKTTPDSSHVVGRFSYSPYVNSGINRGLKNDMQRLMPLFAA